MRLGHDVTAGFKMGECELAAAIQQRSDDEAGGARGAQAGIMKLRSSATTSSLKVDGVGEQFLRRGTLRSAQANVVMCQKVTFS
jgi:hypothetical protein